MATGFFNALSSQHHATSAGTHAESFIGTPLPEYVVRCMSESGVDISAQTRTQLTEELIEQADLVAMITAKEDWPEYVKRSPKVVFWDVPDAKDRSYEFCCNIRDQMSELVRTLSQQLGI